MLMRLHAAKSELRALTVAMRHERTPWYAKALLLLIVAYAVSPIDLIPDPIPVLGYLDDALLLPLGIVLVVRLIPGDVLAACRTAPEAVAPRWAELFGLALVVFLWAASGFLLWQWLA